MTEDRPSAAGDRPTVAVIGSGVSGLTAAYLLRHTHRVTVFEADSRPGGHAHTHEVADSAGRTHRIDSGFIVHNERTYPQLRRLFDELGIATRATEMSMSVHCDGCGLEYAGGRGAQAIVGRQIVDNRFVRMLTEVRRFHREARRLLAAGDDGCTWEGFLRAHRFSPYFVRHFALPLVSCVWSCGSGPAGRYPALYLFRFLDHHGMLRVGGSPTWRTVVGGSRTYVDEIVARVGDVRTSSPARAVLRHDDGVSVFTADRCLEFDRVVLATHADTALDLLADATPAEKSLLGAFSYSVNPAWLHTDPAVLPSRRWARASWNYRMRDCQADEPQVLVSYWMNRLQGLDAADQYLVTLNPRGWVDPSTVVSEMTYAHPVFTPGSVAAGRFLREAGGPRLAFAGAHLGWGFHEDGSRSGVDAAARFGVRW